MNKPEDFVGMGQTQLRENGAHPNDARGWITAHANGLTKVEFYAGLALMGLLANNPSMADAEEIALTHGTRMAKLFVTPK